MVKKNILFNYVGQGWAALMGIAFVPSYIEYLGMDGYGLIGVFAVMQIWFSLLDMGMALTLNREIARYTAGEYNAQYIGNLLRSLEIIALVIGISISFSVAMSAEWVSTNWLNSDVLTLELIKNSIVLIGLVIGLRIVEGLYRSVLVGMQRQALYNVILILSSTFRWGGALAVLILIESNLLLFFFWQLISSFLTLVMLAISAYVVLPKEARTGRFAWSVLTKIASFAVGAFAITALSLAINNIDKIVLMKFISLTDYGFYILAYTVAGAANVLIGPIIQAYYPRFCQLYAKQCNKIFSETYHEAAQLISVFYGTIALIIIASSTVIIWLWTGDEILTSRVSPLLSVLMLGNLLNCLMWIPIQAQLSAGLTGMLIRFYFIALLIFVPLVALVAPSYGAIGVAWVWVFINLFLLVVMIFFMHRKILIGEMYSWLYADVFIPLSSSAFVVFTLVFVINFEYSSRLITAVQLCFISVAAIFFSFLSINKFRFLFFKKISSLILSNK